MKKKLCSLQFSSNRHIYPHLSRNTEGVKGDMERLRIKKLLGAPASDALICSVAHIEPISSSTDSIGKKKEAGITYCFVLLGHLSLNLGFLELTCFPSTTRIHYVVPSLHLHHSPLHLPPFHQIRGSSLSLLGSIAHDLTLDPWGVSTPGNGELPLRDLNDKCHSKEIGRKFRDYK